MAETVDSVLQHGSEQMDLAIEHLKKELTKIRTGKASAGILEGLHVDYYGSSAPLSQVANVGVADARTITIQPWEKSMLTPIEKAIQMANLGLNPQNDGIIIRIVVPPLTEERRQQLTKTARGLGEDAKVGIRNSRKEAMEQIKKLQKDGLPEDEAKSAETKIQDMTNSHVALVDKHIEQKEKEIMTV
jgi:ribosome recycling factor